MWVYGGTDLADLHTDRISLRKVAARVWAIPRDAPVWHEVQADLAKAEATEKVTAVEDTLAEFLRTNEGGSDA